MGFFRHTLKTICIASICTIAIAASAQATDRAGSIGYDAGSMWAVRESYGIYDISCDDNDITLYLLNDIPEEKEEELRKMTTGNVYINEKNITDFDDVLHTRYIYITPEQGLAEFQGVCFEIDDSGYTSGDVYMIPLRGYIEFLNKIGDSKYKIGWNDSEKTIEISPGASKLIFSCRDNTVTFNGSQPIPLKHDIVIKEGTSYISSDDFSYFITKFEKAEDDGSTDKYIMRFHTAFLRECLE